MSAQQTLSSQAKLRPESAAGGSDTIMIVVAVASLL